MNKRKQQKRSAVNKIIIYSQSLSSVLIANQQCFMHSESIQWQDIARYPKLSVSVGTVPIFHVRFRPLFLECLYPRLRRIEKRETGDVDSTVHEFRKVDFVQWLKARACNNITIWGLLLQLICIVHGRTGVWIIAHRQIFGLKASQPNVYWFLDDSIKFWTSNGDKMCLTVLDYSLLAEFLTYECSSMTQCDILSNTRKAS